MVFRFPDLSRLNLGRTTPKVIGTSLSYLSEGKKTPIYFTTYGGSREMWDHYELKQNLSELIKYQGTMWLHGWFQRLWMNCNDIWMFQGMSGSESESEQPGMGAQDQQ